MTQPNIRLNKAKLLLACIMVAGHLTVLATIAVCWMLKGFFTDQFLNLFGAISPIFAAYVTITITYYSDKSLYQSSSPSDSLLPMYASSAAAVLGIIILEAGALMSGVAGTLLYEEYLKVVIVVETLFGVYLGIAVPKYFAKGK